MSTLTRSVRRGTTALGLVLSLALAMTLAAPVPSQADAGGDATGTVRVAGADPSAIVVEVYRASDVDLYAVRATTRPGHDGTWTIRNLAAGTYIVLFRPPTRWSAPRLWGDTTSTSDATRLTITEGTITSGVDIDLTVAGYVPVIPSSRRLVTDAQLTLYAAGPDGRWTSRHRVSADPASGAVGFSRVPAGSYRLGLAQKPGSAMVTDRTTAPETFWPSASDIEDGQDLVVGPGDHATLDIALPDASTLTPSAAPAIDGTFRLGTSARTSAGSWPEGTRVVDQQWHQTVTADLDNTYAPIEGETSPEIALDESLSGAYVFATTTVATTDGRRAVHWSVPRRVTRPFASTPTLSITPVFAGGTARAVLSGTWSPAAKELTYEWSVDGRPLGHHGSSLQLERSLAGKTVRVQVTAQGANASYAVLSSTTAVKPLGRSLRKRPVIREARVGGITGLHDIWAIWSPMPDSTQPSTYAFDTRWFLDGRPTVEPPLPLPARYAGHRLQARITLNQVGFAPKTITTPVVTVLRALFDTAGRPEINQYLAHGSTARVDPGRWLPWPSGFRYQWYAGSRKIKGATGKRLRMTSRLVGKKVRVRVTAVRPGYTPTSRWSQQERVDARD